METLLLAALQAGITGSGELVLELLDAACRIDELQFACVEGMAHAADIDLQFLTGAARGELVAAAAGDVRFVVFGMDAVFHGLFRLDHFWKLLSISRAGPPDKPASWKSPTTG